MGVDLKRSCIRILSGCHLVRCMLTLANNKSVNTNHFLNRGKMQAGNLKPYSSKDLSIILLIKAPCPLLEKAKKIVVEGKE
jgi:hypothetical protein